MLPFEELSCCQEKPRETAQAFLKTKEGKRQKSSESSDGMCSTAALLHHRAGANEGVGGVGESPRCHCTADEEEEEDEDEDEDESYLSCQRGKSRGVAARGIRLHASQSHATHHHD